VLPFDAHLGGRGSKEVVLRLGENYLLHFLLASCLASFREVVHDVSDVVVTNFGFVIKVQRNQVTEPSVSTSGDFLYELAALWRGVSQSIEYIALANGVPYREVQSRQVDRFGNVHPVEGPYGPVALVDEYGVLSSLSYKSS
jgi:hypothetical protein